ncbi:MAG: DUF899 family protein [Candidatus Brocadiae bacterium]|nr:DUF899 family protein [Candidatus Brocadiia bacterium]
MTDDTLEARIAKADAALAKARQNLLDLIRKRGPEEVTDVAFTGGDGKPVRLSQLFGGRKDLILIHSMGVRCPDVLWLDELNGARVSLEDRASLVVAGPDGVAEQKAYAKERGWGFRMVSAAGTTFFRDMEFEEAPGKIMPGISAFSKSGAQIVRQTYAYFAPGDMFCGLWNCFDLLKDGSAGWFPKGMADSWLARRLGWVE